MGLKAIYASLRSKIRGALRSSLREELAASELHQHLESKLTTGPTQVALRMHYRQLAQAGHPAPKFSEVEFSVFSQNAEDGILLYLFSVLGTTNRRIIEVCCGDGIECNAANLIVHHGFQGFLVDGSERNLAAGHKFYNSCRTTRVCPPTLHCGWITAETVNDTLAKSGWQGAVDLLSIDIDGNDYWVWKAIDVIQPRILAVEFNPELGPTATLTMPYKPDFVLDFRDKPFRCGASLAAFSKLCSAKGYRLVGVESLGFNAFFVRNDEGQAILPTKTPDQCFQESERLGDWTPDRLARMRSGGFVWQEV